MSKVKLISTATHLYDGRNLKPGDLFEAIPQDARLLKAIDRAKDAPVAAPPAAPIRTKVIKAESDGPEQSAAETTRRDYKRRDLKAED